MHFKTTYTVGKLYVDGKEFCDTLEDVVRDYSKEGYKVPGKTAIPYGTYKLEMRKSPSFSDKYFDGKKLPYLVDVPNFTNVLIHQGNTSRDTEGCILLGTSGNPSVDWISNSKAAVLKLLDYIESLNGEEMALVIEKYVKR